VIAIEAPSGGQTVEVVSTLCIASGSQGNGTSGPGRHGIIMLLMNLYVGAKLKLAVLDIVNLRPNNYLSWTQSIRNATCCRKRVKPESTIVYEFNCHSGWEAFKGHHVDDTTSSLFDCTDVSLDFWHVFISSNYVQSNPHLSHLTCKAIFIKLSIHE